MQKIYKKDTFWIWEWKINKKNRKIKFYNDLTCYLYELFKSEWTSWYTIVKHLWDTIFSFYIRLLKWENGYCECICTKQRLHRTEIQNGHYKTRWHMKYRYDVKNCRPQSYYSNCILNWDYQRYTLEMQKINWNKRVDDVINDNEIYKYEQYKLEDNIVVWFEFVMYKKDFRKYMYERFEKKSKKSLKLYLDIEKEYEAYT